MRLRAVTVAGALVGLAGACSSSGAGVSLAPTIIFPQGLLDNVTKVSLSVYAQGGGVDCVAATGTVSGASGQTPLATKDLGSTGCPNGAKFCGDVSIDKTDAPRIFSAQAFAGGNPTPVAAGCTVATPNQDTLQVLIQML